MALTNIAPKLTDSQVADLTTNSLADVEKYGRTYRYGQSLMNRLFDVSPELYNEVTATKADCFYKDRNMVDLYDYIIGNGM